MAHANTFDVQKFGWILKEEVEKTANSRYNGDSNVGLGKGFQFWCIKNISPKFTEVQIESARSICEGEGPGDRNIDGAWIDENRLYIMQSKFSKLVKKDSDNGNDLEIAKFDATAAEELWNGFEQLELNGADSTVKGKIAQVKRLYNEAIGSHKEIRLIIVVSGYAKKDLIDEVKAINKRFENDRQRYKQHHCDLYDIEMLNQVVSDNTSKPPDSFILRTENDVIIPEVSDQNSTYSVLAVVKAKELIQIRDKHGYNIYHSNFRFVIGTGTARNKMIATLSDPEEKLNFFRYNNGITVCCKSIKDEKGHKFLIDGFQVVNGLQTIETLYEHSSECDNVSLLMRIIPVPEASVLEEHIAEYSNSQTPITARDL